MEGRSSSSASSCDEFASWSTSQLVRHLRQRGVSTAGCVERSELVALAQQHAADFTEAAAAAPAAAAAAGEADSFAGMQAQLARLRTHAERLQSQAAALPSLPGESEDAKMERLMASVLRSLGLTSDPAIGEDVEAAFLQRAGLPHWMAGIGRSQMATPEQQAVVLSRLNALGSHGAAAGAPAAAPPAAARNSAAEPAAQQRGPAAVQPTASCSLGAAAGPAGGGAAPSFADAFLVQLEEMDPEAVEHLAAGSGPSLRAQLDAMGQMLRGEQPTGMLPLEVLPGTTVMLPLGTDQQPGPGAAARIGACFVSSTSTSTAAAGSGAGPAHAASSAGSAAPSHAAGACTASAAKRCAECGAGGKLRKCGGCRQIYYCTEACQQAGWLGGHRRECKRLAAARQQQQLRQGGRG
ncbi:hypothetical protein ABPG75_002780 [Micractinium tetrahymenae]